VSGQTLSIKLKPKEALMTHTRTTLRHVLVITVLALPLGLAACGSPPERVTKTTTTEESTVANPAVQSSTTTTTTRQTGP